jgi:hypothetical protein
MEIDCLHGRLALDELQCILVLINRVVSQLPNADILDQNRHREWYRVELALRQSLYEHANLLKLRLLQQNTLHFI